MVVRFGGNDYLDLAHDPRVIEAAQDALLKYGASTCASRVSVGSIELHGRLEEQLASFLGFPAVSVLSGGYLAVLAAFDALSGGATRPLLAHLDAAAHPSLLAGARASGAEVRTYRSPSDLERLALADEGDAPFACVATEGVDGFSGRVLPLDEIVGRARAARLPTIIDDAHGIGVLGPCGRGTCAAFGLDGGDGDLLVIGSLGKALASSGGFVAGSSERIEALRSGPSYRASTAIAPPAMAAASMALEILELEPARRTRVADLAGTLKRGLEAMDAPVARGTLDAFSRAFPVATLHFAGSGPAAVTAAELRERGFDVAYFAYASSASSAMLRVPLSARHSVEDVERLLDARSRICHQVS